MRGRKRRNDKYLMAALLFCYYIVLALWQRSIFGSFFFYADLVLCAALAIVLFMERFRLPLKLAMCAHSALILVQEISALGEAGTVLPLLISIAGILFALLMLLAALAPRQLPERPFMWLLGGTALFLVLSPYILSISLSANFSIVYLYVLPRYAALLLLAQFQLRPAAQCRGRSALRNSPADIGHLLFLSFITLGVYRIAWLHRLCEDMAVIKGERGSVMRETLCLRFVPFYGAYWYYSYCMPRLDSAAARCGAPATNDPRLYLLFSIPGLGIINQVLLQQELNAIAAKRYALPLRPLKSRAA